MVDVKLLGNKAFNDISEENILVDLNSPGVYIWGFSLNEGKDNLPSSVNEYLPYLVRSVKDANGSMHIKTVEDIYSLVSGKLKIFDLIEYFKEMDKPIINLSKYTLRDNLNNDCNEASNELYSPSIIYLPNRLSGIIKFNDNVKIRSQISWMLRHLLVYYYTPVKYNEEHIIELEKCIVGIIGSCKLASGQIFNPTNIKFNIVDSAGNSQPLEKIESLIFPIRGAMTAKRFGM